ncbi:hypothetical protein BBJ28_00003391 [Nothophytophthora sp. Chile5]|nr:hypothetical protein BBJ28_00003391 [Nothophytophthora sp. Chile5]
MADDGSVDAAFLAELAELLGESGGLLLPSEGQERDATSGDAHLLAEAALADAEALLSTVSAASSPDQVSTVAQSERTARQKPSSITDPALTERRRLKQKTMAANRRVKYHQRLKDEWKLLRRQEGELSTKLRQLQRTRQDAETCRASNSLLPIGEAIAMRQMTRRHRAEAEQRRLKAAIASKGQLIREMSSFMQWRLREETSLKADDLILPRAQPSTAEGKDTVFEFLLSDLDAVYAQTDEVIRTCGRNLKPRATMRYQPTRKWHNGTEYFENVDAMLVPFDFERTCRAAWMSMITPDMPSTYHYEGVKDPENTVAERFHADYSCETFGVANITVHFVMRKYMEVDRADRFVFVWRALYEGEDEFAGIHLDDTGWGVVYPFASDASDLEVENNGPTILQHFIRSAPVYFGSALNSETTTARFTELVVGSGVEDVEELMRSMGKLLLDDGVSP